MKFKTSDRYSPWFFPTQEDLLDINFSSIVSDGRAIISGTLGPRSWTDISSTWNELPNRMIGGNRVPRGKENSGPHRKYVSKTLIRMLRVKGMSEEEARKKIQEMGL